jgi:hypothetical protein
VAVNGPLMSPPWFFLPTTLRDRLSTVHGTLAFALVLAAWLYSDVPATNVLGPDAATPSGDSGVDGTHRGAPWCT